MPHGRVTRQKSRIVRPGCQSAGLSALTDFATPSWRGHASFREGVQAQPVDATPANRLIGQNFSQGSELSELYSIKPKQDSIFLLYQSPRSNVALKDPVIRF